jgi:hypothetical protein
MSISRWDVFTDEARAFAAKVIGVESVRGWARATAALEDTVQAPFGERETPHREIVINREMIKAILRILTPL